jgi:hypothetical protein
MAALLRQRMRNRPLAGRAAFFTFIRALRANLKKSSTLAEQKIGVAGM